MEMERLDFLERAGNHASAAAILAIIVATAYHTLISEPVVFGVVAVVAFVAFSICGEESE